MRGLCLWEGGETPSGAGPQCRQCSRLGRGDLERSRAARAVTCLQSLLSGDKVGQAVGRGGDSSTARNSQGAAVPACALSLGQ